MNQNDEQINQELHIEFLKSLHNEKIKTQSERSTYVNNKLTFVIGLLGLGSLKIGTVELYWLLFLIPLVAIGFDLYIRASDLSIKKMGVFLRCHPESGTGESERAWEIFSAKCRDTIAPAANTLFTLVVTISAAIYIYVETHLKNDFFLIGFFLWFGLFFAFIILLWENHRKIVKKIDNYNPGNSSHGNAPIN